MANRCRNSGNSGWLYFGGLWNHCRWWLGMKLKGASSLEKKALTNLDSILKSRDIILLTKAWQQRSSRLCFCVWMWGLDYKESWAPKNRCFWTMMLENTLESFGLQGVQPVHPKGDPSWVFIGKTDVGAETPVLWPPDVKSWLIWKDPDAGRGWGQEEKGTTEDEMAGWHHRLDGRESEWTLGVGDGQGGLVCCDSWCCKESDTTEWLNWTELNWCYFDVTRLSLDQIIL